MTTKTPAEFPLTAAEQYPIALKVPCTFCDAEEGEKCPEGGLFPQYPHTDRLKQGLIKQGWTAEEVESHYTK